MEYDADNVPQCFYCAAHGTWACRLCEGKELVKPAALRAYKRLLSNYEFMSKVARGA